MVKMQHEYNIVIIDDDEMVLTGFTVWCEKNLPNVNIKTCTEFSPDCLECEDPLCLNTKFDAIIIDYYLSQNTIAPDIIRNLRKYNKDILIIVMSGKFITKNDKVICANQEIMKQALNCGANRVVPKDIQDVIDITMTHLKIRDITKRNCTLVSITPP